jgi:hypothetical protein
MKIFVVIIISVFSMIFSTSAIADQKIIMEIDGMTCKL